MLLLLICANLWLYAVIQCYGKDHIKTAFKTEHRTIGRKGAAPYNLKW